MMFWSKQSPLLLFKSYREGENITKLMPQNPSFCDNFVRFRQDEPELARIQPELARILVQYWCSNFRAKRGLENYPRVILTYPLTLFML